MCIDKVELRSEKVRNIVGEVPNAINKTGITLVVMLLCIIAMIFSAIYYPISISAKLVDISTKDDLYYVELYIPIKYMSQIERRDKIILIDDYQSHNSQTYTGYVVSVNDIVINSNEKEYFSLNIKFDSEFNISNLKTNNTVKIVLSNNNLLNTY